MGEPTINSPWMTSEEAAAYLRVELTTIRQWAREGRIPHSRSDDRAKGRLMFNRARLDEWLMSREQGGDQS